MTGAGAQTLTGASTTASGDLPLLVINKPSGTLTLAGTIRTTHNWTYTAGTVDPGTSTRRLRRAATITGSHALNAVDFRATTYDRRRDDPDRRRIDDAHVRQPNGTGTARRPGEPRARPSTSTGGTGTLLINGPAGQTFTGAATTAAGDLPVLVINKPCGHAHPGRHDPDDPQLDLHGRDARSRRLDRRLRRRDDHRLAHPHLVDVRATTSIAAGTTLTASAIGQPHDRRPQRHRHAGRPGPVSQASTYHRRDGHPPDQRRRRPDVHRRGDHRAGALPLARHQQAVGHADPGRHDPDRDNWTYTAGTVDPGTSRVVFAGGTLSSAGMSFYDVTTNGATTTLGNAMSIGHTLSVASGTLHDVGVELRPHHRRGRDSRRAPSAERQRRRRSRGNLTTTGRSSPERAR